MVEVPERKYQASPVRRLQQTIAVQLQKAGVIPRDAMGGRYPVPAIWKRAERRHLELMSGQAAVFEPIALRQHTLRMLDVLVDQKIIDFDQKEKIFSLLAPDYVNGMDVSHWQGDLTQEFWQSMAGKGYKFVFVKLLGGTYDPFYKDPKAIQNIERALEAGFAAGGYFWVNATGEVKDQVDAVASYAGSLVPDLTLGLQFDLENDNGRPGSEVNRKLETAIGYVDGDPRFKAAWVYSNKGFMDPRPTITLNAVRGKYYPWPASWTTMPQPTLPNIWLNTEWGCWQFTKTLEGRSLDGDRMKIPIYNTLTQGGNGGPGDGKVVTLQLDPEDASRFIGEIDSLQSLADSIRQAMNP